MSVVLFISSILWMKTESLSEKSVMSSVRSYHVMDPKSSQVTGSKPSLLLGRRVCAGYVTPQGLNMRKSIYFVGLFFCFALELNVLVYMLLLHMCT